MLQHIKKLFKDNSIYIAIGITLLIAMLSLIKLGKLPIPKVHHIDKLEHALAYFVLTLFWLMALHKKLAVYKIITLCVFYGMVIEVLQGVLTVHRVTDVYDVLANTIGVLIALLCFSFFKKKTKLL